MLTWPLKGKPYAVQAEGYRLGHDQECFAYWMEQGLGKTALDYADFVGAVIEDRCEVLVVISPYYLMSGWEDEAKTWGVDMPLFIWPAAPAEARKPPYIFIINIEAAREGRGMRFLIDLMKRRKCMLTIEESTCIKNFQALLSKTVQNELAPLAVLRRELSGLPMPQSVMDLWPQLRFVKLLNGVNPYQFRNKYAVMGGYMRKQVVGSKNEDVLQRIMAGRVFRALKEDWAKELPEKIHVTRNFEMTARQREHYKSMMEDFYVLVQQGEPDSAVFADQVITMLLKLQQISRGFIMDGERVAQELVDPKDNSALLTVKEMINGIQGKVIIFTHYRYSVEMLRRALLKDWNFVTLLGGMTTEEIKRAKAEFNENPEVKGVIGVDSVLAKGHTLLGQPGPKTRCSDTIFYENSFNYEIRAQGEDRNHRWGQDRAVTYTDMVCSSIDKKFIAALQKKEKMLKLIVDAIRSTGGRRAA